MIEEKLLINSWVREPKIISRIHEFYISGVIDSPEVYIDMYDIIRHAGSADVVKIYINSFGGDLFSAIQFLRVLSDTLAEVIVSIEGACMSAATLILLAADSVEITPHSSIMLHDYSSGAYGKGGDLHRQIVHERRWSEALFRELYKDFLSDMEITSMLEGKEIWLTSNETTERLQKRLLIRKEQAELEEATKPD